MDSIFLLDEGNRASFLRQMMQSFGCVYICLWSYLPPPSNCLLALDGLYGETTNLARRLFDVYRESVIYVDTGRIPGLAFKNKVPYMELKLHDFPRLVSGEVQLQFYREAGIKTVVLVGCATGEIELGMASDPQVDQEKELNKLINSVQPKQHLPSSSSSSLYSLSENSPPEYSPLLFNNINVVPSSFSSSQKQPPPPPPPPLLMGESSSSRQQLLQEEEAAKQALSQIRNVQLPTIESEDAAMTKAILAVLSAASPSQSSQAPPTAFTRYRGGGGGATTPPTKTREKQNKFKRAVSFFRNLNWRSTQDQAGNRPSLNQLHHMISERRRREKLNESFHLLRSFLPPGSKKDKASVLSSTTEYLSSLKSQVEELVNKNQMLESQLSARKSVASHVGSSERVHVEITQVSSSTSEARFLDLRVSVGGESSMLDLLTRLIEFLKQQRNVSLLSLESNTSISGSVPVHGVVMTLKIEGDEFDDSGFEEGVRRVAADDQPR